jgi:hypothetical protein
LELLQTYPLRQIADFEKQDYFFTKDQPNSWMCYDFREMRVKLSHYSIRARFDMFRNDFNKIFEWFDFDKQVRIFMEMNRLFWVWLNFLDCWKNRKNDMMEFGSWGSENQKESVIINKTKRNETKQNKTRRKKKQRSRLFQLEKGFGINWNE